MARRRGDTHRLMRWLWTSRRADAKPPGSRCCRPRDSGARRWRPVRARTGADGCGRAPLPVPAIGIGNLTVGGSGRTAVTVWVARHFAEQGVPTGLLLDGAPGHRSGAGGGTSGDGRCQRGRRGVGGPGGGAGRRASAAGGRRVPASRRSPAISIWRSSAPRRRGRFRGRCRRARGERAAARRSRGPTQWSSRAGGRAPTWRPGWQANWRASSGPGGRGPAGPAAASRSRQRDAPAGVDAPRQAGSRRDGAGRSRRVRRPREGGGRGGAGGHLEGPGANFATRTSPGWRTPRAEPTTSVITSAMPSGSATAGPPTCPSRSWPYWSSRGKRRRGHRRGARRSRRAHRRSRSPSADRSEPETS